MERPKTSLPIIKVMELEALSKLEIPFLAIAFFHFWSHTLVASTRYQKDFAQISLYHGQNQALESVVHYGKLC